MNGCELLTMAVRFLSFTRKTEGGCRIWIGAQSRGGKRPKSGPYGSFYVDKKTNAVRAHVVAAFLVGKIPALRVPPGMNLDHCCENGNGTLCVDCLALIPAETNRQLAKTRPMPKAAQPAPGRSKRRKRPSRVKRVTCNKVRQQQKES